MQNSKPCIKLWGNCPAKWFQTVLVQPTEKPCLQFRSSPKQLERKCSALVHLTYARFCFSCSWLFLEILKPTLCERIGCLNTMKLGLHQARPTVVPMCPARSALYKRIIPFLSAVCWAVLGSGAPLNRKTASLITPLPAAAKNPAICAVTL